MPLVSQTNRKVLIFKFKLNGTELSNQMMISFNRKDVL